MTTNAKLEFLEHVKDHQLLAADLEYRETHLSRRKITLYPDYTPEEYQNFLDQLNFNYDSGYGRQFLFGEIFYQDGTWAIRQEYDGAEGWEDIIKPTLPIRPN